MPAELPTKRYLGDGAYAEWDPAGPVLVLTTSNGIRDTNRIELGADEIAALLTYLGRGPFDRRGLRACLEGRA